MEANETNRKIIAIPVVQNKQDFLIGVFTIDQMLRFTKYTHRLIVGFNDDGMPEYNPHIQRKVENSRAEKIADFLIEDPEATFPTNIVLHLPSEAIEEQMEKKSEEVKFLEITLKSEVLDGVERDRKREDDGDIYITIIDGQHRIRGIELAIQRLSVQIDSLQKTLRGGSENKRLADDLKIKQNRLNDLKQIRLVVSFFVDKSLEYQAMIFSTINRTQKKVTESLVYDLFGLTSKDSPQKTALQVVLALNAHSNSPFFERVKLYGGTYKPNESPPLSQATMVKSVLYLICENQREAEIDRFRDRKDLLTRKTNYDKPLPFRRFYARNEDTKISDILFFFFSAVRESFVENGVSLWDFQPEKMKATTVLHTTVGYLALLKILVDIIHATKEEAALFSKEFYKGYLDKATSLPLSNLAEYPLTSKTKTILYLELAIKIFPTDPRVDEWKVKLKELRAKPD